MSKVERSKKTQEVHAEQLLKLSTNLMTAFFVVILIVPISAIVSAAFNGINISPKEAFLNLFGSWYAIVFIAAEVGLYYLVGKTKDNALATYDELYPDEQNKAWQGFKAGLVTVLSVSLYYFSEQLLSPLIWVLGFFKLMSIILTI